jgi:hypothetical protein
MALDYAVSHSGLGRLYLGHCIGVVSRRPARRRAAYASLTSALSAQRSMLIPSLSLFLLPPCSTTKGQSIAVMLVVFTTFICSLIAQLAFRSRCRGGIIIIGILAPLFRLSIGSFAGLNKHHRQCS